MLSLQFDIALISGLLLLLQRTFALSTTDQLANAAGNTTILQETLTSGWVTGASSRGTADILWSCIITIVASVYTAMHLNISPIHISKWRRFKNKCRWAGLALLAPELIMAYALEQRLRVRTLLKDLEDVPPAEHARETDAESKTMFAEVRGLLTPNKTTSRKKYTTAHGFWIIMGGFAIDVDDLNDRTSRVTVTPKGAILLAQQGLLPQISEEQIADRSKANAVGKALVCFQACWMVLQCIARHAAGYPLTLLEVHTTVHVACALIIYILWWEKPLDVEEPISIDTTSVRDLVATMLMAQVPRLDEQGPELPYMLTIYPPSQEQDDYLMYSFGEHAIYSLSSDTATSKPFVFHNFPPLADLWTTYSDTIYLRSNDYMFCGLGNYGARPMELSRKDVQRWNIATPLLQRRRMPGTPGWDPLEDLSVQYAGCVSTTFVSDHVLLETEVWHDYFRIDGILNNFSKKGGLLGFMLLPMIYGGIHLLAWNFTFPSVVESIIWKVSGIVIMASILTPNMLACNNLYERVVGREWGEVVDSVLVAAFVIMVFLGYICRLFLVVESFISLRTVPLGVWADTPWLQSIPHI